MKSAPCSTRTCVWDLVLTIQSTILSLHACEDRPTLIEVVSSQAGYIGTGEGGNEAVTTESSSAEATGETGVIAGASPGVERIFWVKFQQLVSSWYNT